MSMPIFRAAIAAVFLSGGADAAEKTGDTEPDPVVAIVNGDEIRLSDVGYAHERLPEQYRQIPLNSVYRLLVNSLVDAKLAAAAARAEGMHEQDDIKRSLARIHEQLLERAYMLRYIDEKITEDALKERYDAMVKKMGKSEEIHARHILLETESKAKEVIAELKGGADFAELAKERSTGPSKDQGGDLGYFTKGQMVPAFTEAAFALKKGQITETPVQTRFGWHVIKIEDRRTLKPPIYNEAKQALRGEMSQELGAALVEVLRGEAVIQKLNPDGSPLDGPAATPGAATPGAATPGAGQ